jgi:Fis family transcriptional regulator, factor for inversion stimulation protein
MSDTNAVDQFINKTNTTTSKTSLQSAVDESVARYFDQLGTTMASNVYDMVLAEVEIPLLVRVLKYTRGNQSKAAIVLGLSRGTLRKKLKIYGIEGRIKEVIA